MHTDGVSKYNLKHFTRLMISFFFALAVLSVFQYAVLFYKEVVGDVLGVSFLIAVVHQIGFTALIGLVLVPLFNIMESRSPGNGLKIVFGVLGIFLSIESFLLLHFCTTYSSLGSEVLTYDIGDFINELSHSGSFWSTLMLLMAVVIGLFLGFYRITSKYYHHISKLYPFTIVLFSLFVATLFTEGRPINQNKTQYLVVNLFTAALEDSEYMPKTAYPLLTERRAENVLGEYFHLQSEMPNVVFIIVEGLGRDFMGDGAKYGGFTPFLDSLSTESLYWENFLSNTTDTFGAIPTLLGSLPFGKNGFMSLDPLPNRLTLSSILKNNGYHTSYYQGANSSFHNLDNFLQSENLDFILERSGFGNGYELQPEDSGGFSRGYPDKELYRKSMSLPKPSTQPRMEVYKTLSTDWPFLPPKKEVHQKEVVRLMSNERYGEETKKIIEENKNVFASLLYSDLALKWFFSTSQKQHGYDNTIFVITGSHRPSSVSTENMLSRFHVPLLIYSPMLVTARKISSVSSHLDVAPSLLALLNASFEVKMPKKVAWLGSGLDIQADFRSIKDIPLMRDQNQVEDFIDKNQFLTDGKIYGIDENLALKEQLAHNERRTKKKLQDFNDMNIYLTTKDKIIPEDLAIFKVVKEKFKKSEMVWLNSVFNGKNYDRAYSTARNLAFAKESERALLLCRYILSEVPSHIDTKVLTGRIHAWEGRFFESIAILRSCIEANPSYIDAYAALLDVYFWSGKNKAALQLLHKIEQNNLDTSKIASRIKRVEIEAKKRGYDHNLIPSAKQVLRKTETIATNKR